MAELGDKLCHHVLTNEISTLNHLYDKFIGKSCQDLKEELSDERVLGPISKVLYFARVALERSNETPANLCAASANFFGIYQGIKNLGQEKDLGFIIKLLTKLAKKVYDKIFCTGENRLAISYASARMALICSYADMNDESNRFCDRAIGMAGVQLNEDPYRIKVLALLTEIDDVRKAQAAANQMNDGP